MKRVIAILSAVAALAVTQPRAAEGPPSVDSVAFRDGKLIATLNGESFTPTNAVALPKGVLVSTNAAFTVKEGPKRQLKEGQVIRKDGMLSSPDGSLVPVVDHVAMLEGKPRLVKDGVAQPIQTPVQLADGTRILPDGKIVKPTGSSTRLLDGQLFELSGDVIPATDTVTFKDGVVTLQKDGSQIELPTGRRFMMDNGTTVYGDGRVKPKDGEIRQMNEGETIEIPGVRR